MAKRVLVRRLQSKTSRRKVYMRHASTGTKKLKNKQWHVPADAWYLTDNISSCLLNSCYVCAVGNEKLSMNLEESLRDDLKQANRDLQQSAF